MIDRSLTIEEGMRRAGEVLYIASWEAGPEEPVVIELKETREEVLVELLKSGDITSFKPNGFTAVTEKGRQILRRSAHAQCDIFRAFAEEGLVASGIVDELLCNAIEHGTHYCSQGWVHVRALEGKRGEFWVIDQMNTSISAQQLLERAEAAPHPPDKPGRVRGFGLHKGRNDDLVQVNFQDIEGGVRTLHFSYL